MSNTSTTEELQARIAAERDRLKVEEAREVELTSARLVPLEAGDDAALNEIELQIDASRTAQVRILERLEILEQRVQEQRTVEDGAELDALAAKATQAAAAANRLITGDYAEHAAALRLTLTQVASLRNFIDQANKTLEHSGRALVAPIEAARSRMVSFGQPTTESIRVTPDDTRHPQAQLYWEMHRERAAATSEARAAELTDKMERMSPAQIEVPVRGETIPALHAAAVDREVRLPSVDPSEPAFWDQRSVSDTGRVDIDALLSDVAPARRKSSRTNTNEET